MLLTLALACIPAGDDSGPRDSFDGGQSGSTTAPCGEETRTPITDLDAIPENENDSFNTLAAAHAGTWTGTLAATGESVTFDIAFGTDVVHVYQETCGAFYEVDVGVEVAAASLSGSFSGRSAVWSEDFAPVDAVAGSGDYTTDLSPTGFDPADYGATWLALRSWSEGTGGGRYYGYLQWEAGAGTPTFAATDTTTETTPTSDGVHEEISFFEAYR